MSSKDLLLSEAFTYQGWFIFTTWSTLTCILEDYIFFLTCTAIYLWFTFFKGLNFVSVLQLLEQHLWGHGIVPHRPSPSVSRIHLGLQTAVGNLSLHKRWGHTSHNRSQSMNEHGGNSKADLFLENLRHHWQLILIRITTLHYETESSFDCRTI